MAILSSKNQKDKDTKSHASANQPALALVIKASRVSQAISRLTFPLQKAIASLTARKFSSWARNDRWLNQLGRRGERIILSKTDPTYQAFLKSEIEYWQKPARGDTQTIHGNDEHPNRSRKLREYWNELVTGSPRLSKIEMLSQMGPFENALTLGHFPGLEEIMAGSVAKRWTFNSITGRFADAQAGRPVTIIREDLNFANFKENEYDLIVCEAILHHIVNLDHLLSQINRALTPDGRFVVIDYVGEERFLWKEEKRRFINGLLAQIPLKYVSHQFAGIDSIHFTSLSPFEAVTSTRIPGALKEHVGLGEMREGYGVLFPALLFLKARYLSEDNPIIDLLIEADRESKKYGVQPSAVAGVFTKLIP
jgi:SAM-dependent methyltransferase